MTTVSFPDVDDYARSVNVSNTPRGGICVRCHRAGQNVDVELTAGDAAQLGRWLDTRATQTLSRAQRTPIAGVLAAITSVVAIGATLGLLLFLAASAA